MEYEIPLRVKERGTLLSVVPKQHNFTTMKILTKVVEELGLSEDEVQQYVKQEEGRQRWTNAALEGKDEPKTFRFGETSFNVIRDELKKLDAAKTLGADHLTLYEKFVESKPEQWEVKPAAPAAKENNE